MLDYGFGVVLSRLEEYDYKTIFDIRNKPEIYRWTRQNTSIQWNNHVDWCQALGTNPSSSMFKIDGAKGMCGFTNIDLVNRNAEFSIFLDPEIQKRGYGRMALKTLFRHGFYDLGLNQIWGETLAGNPALNLFKHLGMEVTGERRDHYYRDGLFVDAHLISIGRQSFDAMAGYKEDGTARTSTDFSSFQRKIFPFQKDGAKKS